MHTKISEMFSIELPIFAFSHCRDVVVDVSRAGGFGVLGIVGFDEAQLERELCWIDEHIGDKSYGVDILMPGNYEKDERAIVNPAALLPEGHVQFCRELCDAAGLPPLAPGETDALLAAKVAQISMTPAQSEALVEIAFAHPKVKLMVNALGTPPKRLVERAHSLGIKVGSMVGSVDHAYAQRGAGVDLVIAQGMEAGGHTGKITSMVLWPQVVDALAPMPVLAAGGIGRGRQMAAAIALGAAGVWCGSIWLGTAQSDVAPHIKEKMFEARAEDAVQRRSFTGKACRVLKSEFTEAWERPDAPKPLPMPLQTLLITESATRIERAGAKDLATYPVGQIVGDMRSGTSVRQVMMDMVSEFVDVTDSIGKLVSEA